MISPVLDPPLPAACTIGFYRFAHDSCCHYHTGICTTWHHYHSSGTVVTGVVAVIAVDVVAAIVDGDKSLAVLLVGTVLIVVV